MLNLKAWMTKVTNTLKDILSPTDYGSQFTSNYSGSVCHIYKIGKVVFFQYGCYWGGYAVNSVYTIGTLPAAVRPSYQQITVGQIHAASASCECALTVNIQTDGVITLGSSGWISASAGYPWFSCFYFLN